MQGCLECKGSCCSYVLLKATKEEGQLLKLRGWGEKNGVFYLVNPCRHLKLMGSFGFCSIYRRRPQACKAFEVGGEACLLCRKIGGV